MSLLILFPLPQTSLLILNLMLPLSCLSNSVTLWNYAFVTVLAAIASFTPAALLEGALVGDTESSGPVVLQGPAEGHSLTC